MTVSHHLPKQKCDKWNDALIKTSTSYTAQSISTKTNTFETSAKHGDDENEPNFGRLTEIRFYKQDNNGIRDACNTGDIIDCHRLLQTATDCHRLPQTATDWLKTQSRLML